MNNVMTIDGYQAVIVFNPDISMFRGEFLGLNGGADFYAADVEGLRLDPEVHEAAVIAAAAHGKSLNQWAVETLRVAAQTD